MQGIHPQAVQSAVATPVYGCASWRDVFAYPCECYGKASARHSTEARRYARFSFLEKLLPDAMFPTSGTEEHPLFSDRQNSRRLILPCVVINSHLIEGVAFSESES